MGRVTPAHTVRSWYVTQARALRGEVVVPRLQYASPRVLAMSPPSETMSQFRVRVDPVRAGTRTDALVLRFTDLDARHGWRLRRGVARFEAEPSDPDAVELEVSVEAWLRFFTCRDTMATFVGAARVVRGTREAAQSVLGLFDFHDPKDNRIVPAA